METREAELMDKVQSCHWWWRGRERIVRAMIERWCLGKTPLAIADAGAGYGANLPMLSRYGHVTGLESMPVACAAMRSKHGEAVEIRLWRSPEPIDKRFDLIVMTDVLEHIEDDAAAMRWVREHLNPGGYFVATVPAHKMLWTEMDDVTGHHRRYDRRGLRHLVEGELEILRLSYYNLFLLPLKLAFVLLVRGARRIAPRRPKQSYNDLPSALVNGFLFAILKTEAAIIPWVDLPAGVSLIIVARRRT